LIFFLSVNPNLLGLLGFFVRSLLLVQPLQMPQKPRGRGVHELVIVYSGVELEAPLLALLLVLFDIFRLDPAVDFGS